MEKFKNTVVQRIYQRVPVNALFNAGILEFYVGGNSLNKQSPNDIDLFPVGERFTNEQANKLGEVLCSTKNATTVKVNFTNSINHQTIDGINEVESSSKFIIVQLCNYEHKSLQNLVDSFDFSHIQIGAQVDINSNGYLNVEEVYYTEDYLNSKLCQTTEYTGSEYPLSSLIRAFKYSKRGDFAGNSHIFSVFKLLTDIISRGFDNYEDFKDQLDAVDLGLVPENQDDLEKASKDAGLDFSSSGLEVLEKFMNLLVISKKAIAQDADLSAQYAYILGKRFEDGEHSISKNPKLSCDYARDIVKGRFTLGEDAISTETRWIYNYYDALKNNNANAELPETLHNIMLANGIKGDSYAKYYLSSIGQKTLN